MSYVVSAVVATVALVLLFLLALGLAKAAARADAQYLEWFPGEEDDEDRLSRR